MNFDDDWNRDSRRSNWGNKAGSAGKITLSINIPLALIAGLLGFFVYYQPNNIGASAIAALAMFAMVIVASLVSWLGVIPVFGPIWYVGIMLAFQKWLFSTIGIQSSWLTEAIYTIFFVVAWIITAIIAIVVIVAIITAILRALSR